MQWQDLLGHDQQQGWFRNAMTNGRLASSFLFVGPEGIGKRAFARLLAKSLLCRSTMANELTCCGVCEDCVQVDASTHPDLVQVFKPAEKAVIPVDLLIGEREKRMREGLCYDISLKPFAGRRKVAILDDADFLNAEGANCLLKTLEEPPADSLFILIGTSLQRQLPTIRSRCQAILFRPLSQSDLESLLPRLPIPGNEDDACLSPESAAAVAPQAEGSLTKAWVIADEELQQFRGKLHGYLGAQRLPIGELAKEWISLVDAAGKESRTKRDRMKILFQLAADFYRRDSIQDGQMDSEMATRCWNRCLEAIEQVERNANQASLIESLTADLAVLSSR
ncbi:MAG: DNA polymerase III subunit delta' [Planctomycetota bacterium]|nr:DNA polymerase III subunit delta' [Planctomycetota bacterium]